MTPEEARRIREEAEFEIGYERQTEKFEKEARSMNGRLTPADVEPSDAQRRPS